MVSGSVWAVETVTGVADSDVESLTAIGIVDSMCGQLLLAGWMLSFRSVCKAEYAIWVAVSEVEIVKCDTGRRFCVWSATFCRLDA